MQSSKSSVGSKSSSTGCKDINQLQSYQDNEGIAEVLLSSWIRRLNLRPTSPIVKNKDDPPSIVPITAVNSTSATGSGASDLGPRNTISTDESKTLTSINNGRSTLFFHQLLKNRREKLTLKTDHENCSFPGFGPFQIKTSRTLVNPDKVTSLGDGDNNDDQLMHNCSEFQERNGNYRTGDLGQDIKWKFNYNGNSCENVFSQMLQEEGEEQKIGKNSFLQQNWFNKMGSFQEKKVADDQHRIPVSPFFRLWSASKKNECLRGNTTNQNNKFINPSLKALVGGDQRRYDIRLSEDQWPMYRVSHGISSCSRIGGITCHESYNDNANAAGRICKHPRLTHYNAVLNQDKRHAPPTYPNETGEPPSSFLKMNSFQRAEMVSSIFRDCRTSTRKRILDDEKLVSVKSRKLDLED